MELPDWKVIYSCQWFKNSRCIIPHTVAYFLKPEHCADVLRSPISKVILRLVPINGREYESACRNSDKYELEVTDNHKSRFGHWFEEALTRREN